MIEQPDWLLLIGIAGAVFVALAVLLEMDKKSPSD